MSNFGNKYEGPNINARKGWKWCITLDDDQEACMNRKQRRQALAVKKIQKRNKGVMPS